MTGWQRFERAIAWLCTVAAGLAVLLWVAAAAMGGGLWAVIALVDSVIVLGYGIVWLRLRQRLPWGAGIALFVVTVVPAVYAKVVLDANPAAQAAFYCSAAAIFFAGLVAGRSADRPTLPLEEPRR